MPPITSGPTSCNRKLNSVTMPKFPPPPRNAQNRSGFSTPDVVTTRPSAVTTVAPTRLSQVRPQYLSSQPLPEPSVSPATPVLVTRPPVSARPCSWVAASTIPQVAPPPTVRSRS